MIMETNIQSQLDVSEKKHLDDFWNSFDKMQNLWRGVVKSPEKLAFNRKHPELKIKRLLAFLEMLDNPQNDFQSIHIAGTSGKGSTAVFLANILEQAGYKVGNHTSPFLQSPTEKLVINSTYISAQNFTKLVDENLPIVTKLNKHSSYGSLNYGEFWVALTMKYFSNEKVDIGVIETGVGGRYDVTNVIDPELSIIVSIGYDHTKSLGKTLYRIAQHKAGIIKKNKPVICGVTKKMPFNVIEKEASSLNAPLYRIHKDFSYLSENMTSFIYGGKLSQHIFNNDNLIGSHQQHNATLALFAAEMLDQADFSISTEAMEQGVNMAAMPGRFEIIQKKPTVILDGAHNVDKISALCGSLKEYAPDTPIIMVFGMIREKNMAKTMKKIAPQVHGLIATQHNIEPKTPVPAEKIAKAARKIKNTIALSDPSKAMDHAIKRAERIDGIVCATGSIYLVGALRDKWIPTNSVVLHQTSWPLLS